MENMTIFKQNLLTFGLTRNKLICDCCRRSADPESNKESSDDRPKTESIEIVSTILMFIGLNFNDEPIFQDMPIEGVVNI